MKEKQKQSKEQEQSITVRMRRLCVRVCANSRHRANSTPIMAPPHLLCSFLLCYSQVCQLAHTLVIDQDVRAFDVAMQDAVRGEETEAL